MGPYYVAQVDLQFLPQSPKKWDFKHMPPCLVALARKGGRCIVKYAPFFLGDSCGYIPWPQCLPPTTPTPTLTPKHFEQKKWLPYCLYSPFPGVLVCGVL